MDVRSVGSGGAHMQAMPATPTAERQLSTVDELNVTVSNERGQYQVGAEAQYLFDMQKYLQGLDTATQEKALDYLGQSHEPLQQQVVETFRVVQVFANDLREGKIKILHDEDAFNKAKNLLNTGFVLDGRTEIGVRPNGTDVFRLDGKQDYVPAQGSENNLALIRDLEELEAAASGLLRNRDAANLFGSVSNALVYSEHILLSADDVLHYNYAIEKAKKTIEFVDAPELLKTALTDLLNKGIAWQDSKQTRVMEDNRQLIHNSRVGDLAAEAVRMGSAAQAFNQELLNLFSNSNASFLDSASLIKRVIVEQPYLVRFSPSKIDEALAFYRDDDTHYEHALNRDFSLPEEARKYPIFDNQQKIADASKQYAMKVIDEIQAYTSERGY